MTNIRRTGFRDIKEEILRRIREQVWAPGDLLPGEVALAEEFGCARTTVNRALQELSDEGLIERRRKAGTRVRMSPLRSARFEIPIVRHEIEGKGAAYRYNLISRESGLAPPWLCARLDLPNDTPIVHIRCVHYGDTTPYQYEERWINCAAVPGAASFPFDSEGPNEWLVREVPFSNAEISFFATAADPEVAEFLFVQPNDPVFAAERVTWQDETPVTLVRMYYAPGYRMTTHY